MRFEFLSASNVEQYIAYLRKALTEEPEMMLVEQIDECGIRNRLDDPFFQSKKSILANIDNEVVGRIEYHFYGCLQDGYKMAYVDWVYVRKAYRHRGIAQGLFHAFEEDCRKNNIDQYYLIRATNSEAERFYHGLEDSQLSEQPILRKTICPDSIQFREGQ